MNTLNPVNGNRTSNELGDSSVCDLGKAWWKFGKLHFTEAIRQFSLDGVAFAIIQTNFTPAAFFGADNFANELLET